MRNVLIYSKNWVPSHALGNHNSDPVATSLWIPMHCIGILIISILRRKKKQGSPKGGMCGLTNMPTIFFFFK